MAGNPAPSRYSRTSIALHWLMLLLIAAVYACIELREQFPRGSDPREALKTWHFMLGLTVFALVWIRALARWRSPAPPITPTPAAWQARLAAWAHVLLYAFMLAMPLLGWLSLSADGKPIPFFFFEWPALVAPDEALAKQVEEIHETVGQAGYFLIALHAAAALFHHYLRRDDTLRRMLPGRS
jgi:cytochrome b561